MDRKQLSSLLRKNGMGSILRPNLLFDRRYCFPTIQDVREANNTAARKLAWWDYIPEKSDCDNYAIMWYGHVLEWFYRNGDYDGPVTVGPAIGKWNDNPHMWSIAITDSGIYHYNYGQEQKDATVFKAQRVIMA